MLGRHVRCHGSTAPAVFDPATLALTAWWRASYTASPWVGTASAGSSGSRDLTEATNPPSVGSALNGFTPADCDGSNDILTNATTLTNYITNTAYFGWCLFMFDAATGGTGTFGSPNLIADNAGFWGVAVYDDTGTKKIDAWHWDGSAKRSTDTISTGAWTLVCWRYDGTNIRLKVNSASVQVNAAGSVSTLTGTMEAANGFSGFYFDGKIAEIGLMASAESDARFDDIKAYINNRYGLSL